MSTDDIPFAKSDIEMMSDIISMAQFRAKFPDYHYRSTTKEYYEWKILENPNGIGNIFFERNPKGMVVGARTITLKRVSIGGKAVTVAERGDAFTHPDYQRQGISTRLLNATTEYAIGQGIQVIYGIPNANSLPGTMKKGHFPCPFVSWKLLEKRLWGMRSVIKSMAKTILHRKLEPIDLIMFKGRFSRKSIPGASESITISTVTRFTDEIDGLWGSSRYLFFTVRDRTYLNWRYIENPDDYQVIVAKKGAMPMGYIVTKLSKNRRVGIICDFITMDDRLDVFHLLLREVEKRLKGAGVQIIRLRCVEDSPYYQAMIDQGYYDHDKASPQPVTIFSGTNLGKMLLETNGKWHFTFSDTDNV